MIAGISGGDRILKTTLMQSIMFLAKLDTLTSLKNPFSSGHRHNHLCHGGGHHGQ